MFTRACHSAVSRAIRIQSKPPNPIYLKSILTASTYKYVGLAIGIFPRTLPPKHYMHFFSVMRAKFPSPLTILYLNVIIVLGLE
jgi:hypothetical protein